MRTLKKALSLVLVLAMVFALAVPGFAADTTKKASSFKDYSKITNKEAVDVMTAIGVISGNDDGTFKPEGNFTRAEAASIIAHMMLGAGADAQPSSATKFTDVPATHWASKYIAYCAQQGIVNGYGNGKFGPDDALSAHSWALMLLGALGYNAKNEGIGGNGWEIGTTKLAIQAGVASASELGATFNRDMAAKFAFNTLTATEVQYTGGVDVSTSDGTSITVGATRTQVPSAAAANYDDATAGDGLMQFCEEHFADLKKVSAGSGDAFGAPAYTWKNGVKTTGTYAAKALVTYTTNMKTTDGKTQIAADLNGYTLGSSVATATNKGTTSTIDLSSNVDALAALTGNGKIVSVYTTGTAVTKVVVASYDLYKVSVVNANNNSVVLTKVSNGSGSSSLTVTKTSTNKDFYAQVSGLVKDDVILVADNSGAVLATANASKISGAYTAKTGANYTIGGTAYPAAANATLTALTTLSAATQYDAYLDQFGNLIFAEAQAGTTNYAYVLATSKDGTALNGYEYSAKLLFADGTIKWVKVNAIGGTKVANNTTLQNNIAGDSVYTTDFITYSENSDGSYNIVTNTDAVENDFTSITTGTPTLSSTVVANSKTVFLVKQADGTYKSYTGIKNVPNITGITTTGSGSTAGADVYAPSGIAKMIVVDTGAATGTESKYVYFYTGTPATVALDGDTTVYTYNAIVDGVKTTVESTLSTVTPGMYVNLTTDAKGRISALNTELAVSGTTSKLGAKGNIGVDYSATAVKLTIANGVLTITAGSGEIFTADSATAATAVTGTTKAISVADGFTAYTIVENSATAPADILTISEDAAVAGNIANDVIVTVNSNGEATALYVLSHLA